MQAHHGILHDIKKALQSLLAFAVALNWKPVVGPYRGTYVFCWAWIWSRFEQPISEAKTTWLKAQAAARRQSRRGLWKSLVGLLLGSFSSVTSLHTVWGLWTSEVAHSAAQPCIRGTHVATLASTRLPMAKDGKPRQTQGLRLGGPEASVRSWPYFPKSTRLSKTTRPFQGPF